MAINLIDMQHMVHIFMILAINKWNLSPLGYAIHTRPFKKTRSNNNKSFLKTEIFKIHVTMHIFYITIWKFEPNWISSFLENVLRPGEELLSGDQRSAGWPGIGPAHGSAKTSLSGASHCDLAGGGFDDAWEYTGGGAALATSVERRTP